MKALKTILIGIVFIALIIIIKNLINKSILTKQYHEALDQKEKEYTDSIYARSFKGILTYINEYKDNKYVINITDSNGKVLAIGKIPIRNFSNFKLGDSIEKLPGSFFLKSVGKKQEIIAILEY